MVKYFLHNIRQGASILAVAVAMLAGSQAFADTVSIRSGHGESGLGAYAGSLSYDSALHRLTIVLTNTSSDAVGGYITGIAFNMAGNATATYIRNGSSDPFQGLSGSVKAQPFGYFEAGAALGGNWDGGGNTTAGVGINQTWTFSFNIAGPDASKLSALSFLSEGSMKHDPAKNNKPPKGSAKPSGDEGANEPFASERFAVRLKGFDNNGSDKVPGVVVPLPNAAWSGMGLLGLLAVGGIRRKLNQSK